MRGQPFDDQVYAELEALHRLGRDDLMPTVAETLRSGEGASLVARYTPGVYPAVEVSGHGPGDWARLVLHHIDADRWEIADALFGRPIEPGDVAGLDAMAGTNRARFVEQRSDSNVARAWQQENARHVRATTPELANLGYTGLDWEGDVLGFPSEYLGSVQGKDIYHDSASPTGPFHGRLIAYDSDTAQSTVLATGVTADTARRAVERAKALLDRKASLYDVRALATAPPAPAAAAAPSM